MSQSRELVSLTSYGTPTLPPTSSRLTSAPGGAGTESTAFAIIKLKNQTYGPPTEQVNDDKTVVKLKANESIASVSIFPRKPNEMRATLFPLIRTKATEVFSYEILATKKITNTNNNNTNNTVPVLIESDNENILPHDRPQVVRFSVVEEELIVSTSAVKSNFSRKRRRDDQSKAVIKQSQR